jgi:pimeloyl-ACP methyl ester carboxylesterase
MSNLRVVDGPGSRALGVATWGDPEGRPIISIHGTPGSRLRRPPTEDGLREAGLLVISYDRPGYGASDRHAGRTIVDCVEDVRAIADALGLDRFHVTGGSGGGPHALAVAARLGDRVVGAECAVCPAPYDAEDLDWFGGMDQVNIDEFGWALAGEETLHRELTREASDMLARMDTDPAQSLGEVELESADRAVLARADVQQMLSEMVREAFRPGVWGWVDDDLAMTVPWGFDLTEIEVPVTIRYGAEDVLVPAAHGEWLAEHLPQARVEVDHSGGHLLTPEQQLASLKELAGA